MKDTIQQAYTTHEEPQGLIFNWETKFYGNNSYEEFIPPIPCQISQGPILSFCREETDDSHRTQYDLYVEVLDKDGESTAYMVASNLYASQCESRIEWIISEYRVK
jgi:hypothetical protein